MTSKEVQTVNELGLHLRAAGTLVQVTSKFKSKIFLDNGSHRANAKSIMSVLALAAQRGVVLVLSAEGEDEQQAIDAICELFADGFGE